MPTKEQALQFAVMLSAGLPASEAIQYFVETADPAELQHLHSQWMRSRAVRQAILTLQGKSWQEMSLDEKIHYALDLHYAQLAYFLLSHNYGEMGTTDKPKADTARQALEAKLAGLAGKGDELSRFFDDLRSGKLTSKLKPVAVALPATAELTES